MKINLFEKIKIEKIEKKKIESDFTYHELIRSDTAKRKNIKNIPNEEQIENLERLITNILQPVRDKFGPIRVTSGFRSPELCKALGSSIYSNHTRGEAADIEPVDKNIKLIDIMDWIYYNCEFRELIAEYFPDGWVHVAYRKNQNIKKVKLKDADHTYLECSLPYINSIYKKGLED
jgi:zinc D-Ala-D-Ala carboxypeptidase